MPSKRKTKTVPTLAEVAKHFSISETTVYLGKRTHADFPTKHRNGYRLDEFETFASRHAIWHRSGSNGNGHGMTLAKARMDQILQSTGRLRIANQRAQLELDILTSKLAWRSDVESFHRQLAGVILEALKSLDGIADELPMVLSSATQWQQLRVRIVRFNGHVGQSVAASVRAFVAKYEPERTE